MRHLSMTAALAASLVLNVAWADELIMPQAASAAESEAPAADADATSAAAVDTPDSEAPADAASTATVDTPKVPAPVVAMPHKGQTMAEVVKAFGPPKTKHKPTGGNGPRQPVITRWDYETFTVVFEKDRVVNSINPQAPPKLQHVDKLQPLEY